MMLARLAPCFFIPTPGCDMSASYWGWWAANHFNHWQKKIRYFGRNVLRSTLSAVTAAEADLTADPPAGSLLTRFCQPEDAEDTQQKERFRLEIYYMLKT